MKHHMHGKCDSILMHSQQITHSCSTYTGHACQLEMLGIMLQRNGCKQSRLQVRNGVHKAFAWTAGMWAQSKTQQGV